MDFANSVRLAILFGALPAASFAIAARILGDNPVPIPRIGSLTTNWPHNEGGFSLLSGFPAQWYRSTHSWMNVAEEYHHRGLLAPSRSVFFCSA